MLSISRRLQDCVALTLWKELELLKSQVICEHMQTKGPLFVMQIMTQGSSGYLNL